MLSTRDSRIIIMNIFPESLLNQNKPTLTLDSIKAKLNYFHLQLNELHWQTKSYSEHKALGVLYEKVADFKDEIVEKIMGYSGTRTKAMPVQTIIDYSVGASISVVKDLIIFSKELQTFGSTNNMPDIENIAQSLNGEAAKTMYLLSLN